MSDSKITSTKNRWWLLVEVIEVRLRFVVILLATGLFIGYWGTIKNYWDKWTRSHTAMQTALPADKEFFCPMHLSVVRSSYEPNGSIPNCPICGMALSLRTKVAATSKTPGAAARVQLSPERIQLAGVQTAMVDYRPLRQRVDAVGSVAFDESRQSRVVSRVNGYVEKLYVDKTYMVVAQGDPLAEIYSPEIFSTAGELLAAARDGNAAMVDSTRRRLQLFGVNDKEIDAILAAHKASPQLVIRSPQTGCVIRKNIIEGMRVNEGMTLLELADLSSVWIEADLFEREIAMVHEGQTVEATVEAFPNRTFHGKVALVYPQMDTATRTNRVRMQIDNRTGELRPGMFVTVKINVRWSEIEPFESTVAGKITPKVTESASSSIRLATPAGKDTPVEEVLSVPRSAVIDTGAAQIVYIERQPGLFEATKVALGPVCDDYYTIVRGLKAGDHVAAAGSFLVDAETRLNPSAASAYLGAAGGPASGSANSAVNSAANSMAKLPYGGSMNGPASGAEVTPARAAGKALENLNQLPHDDRALARAQGICPITGTPLGTMGVPLKVVVEGQSVFVCCRGCIVAATNNASDTLEKVARSKKAFATSAGTAGKP